MSSLKSFFFKKENIKAKRFGKIPTPLYYPFFVSNRKTRNKLICTINRHDPSLNRFQFNLLINFPLTWYCITDWKKKRRNQMHEDISLSFGFKRYTSLSTMLTPLFCFIQKAKRETRIRWNEEGKKKKKKMITHAGVKRGYSFYFLYISICWRWIFNFLSVLSSSI